MFFSKDLAVILLTLIVLVTAASILISGFLRGIAQAQGPVTPYDDIISQASARYGVEQVLIKALIKRESDFNPSATSGKGCMGLMQISNDLIKDLNDPRTVVGRTCKLEINDPFDPEQNINAGTCYLAYLLKKYHNIKELALAAYNCGPENIDRATHKYGYSWKTIEPHLHNYCRGTTDYVNDIMRYYEEYKNDKSWLEG